MLSALLAAHHGDSDAVTVLDRTLDARAEQAAWTGQAGEPAEALRPLRELLPDRERVLGVDRPATLTTREWIAALEQEPRRLG